MMHSILEFFEPHSLPLIYALVIVLVLPLVAGYIVLLERKVMADMQVRLGPMRVGPHGLLQPVADAIKLLLKEDILPAEADPMVFWLAPLIVVWTAFTVFIVVPFGPTHAVTDMNIGVLFMLGVASLRLRAGSGDGRLGVEFALSIDRRIALERTDGVV